MHNVAGRNYICYTDGSCFGNGRADSKGGWAFIILTEDEQTISEGIGEESPTTNNRMELKAVIEALKTLTEPTSILIKTDSRYVIDAFKKNWISVWKKDDYIVASGEKRKNWEMWIELEELVSKHNVSWEWVKGHSGVCWNEYVDMRAFEAWKKPVFKARVHYVKKEKRTSS